MNYLLAIILMPLFLGLWLLAQRAGRIFSRAHPEFGRFRELGGCGSSCGCKGTCSREQPKPRD